MQLYLNRNLWPTFQYKISQPTSLTSFCLKRSLKGEEEFSTVYECVKQQITEEFVELKCLVYLVNPDDKRDLEYRKQKDKGEWEHPYLLPCVSLALPLRLLT
jgi:hypothetical protein